MFGFKSFADKTEFDFGDGITVIVGPNGCGKSNVVDAIKWVLGEQSAKSLRGGNMLDVIFSGTNKRKSMGMAEVALEFGGTQGVISDDLDEVKVTRRLYRSGESEYLLNDNACRLKDIRELFMGTGIGADAYSIIEQGRVEQLLQTNKSDRRAIFEEAAGISKYKARRKEATRKLDRTEQNLLRLTDVVAEIDKSLRSIKYQAGKARNYQTYSARLNDLRLHKYMFDYHQVVVKTEKTSERLIDTQEGLELAAVEANDVQVRLDELSGIIDAALGEVRQAENKLLESTGQIENQTDRISHGGARCTELLAQIAKARVQIQSLAVQKNELQQEVNVDQENITTAEAELAVKQSELETLQSARQEEAMQLVENRAQLEDEKSGLFDIVRRTAQLHNDIKACDVRVNSLEGQKERLSDRSGQISSEVEEQVSIRVQLSGKLTELETLLTTSREQLELKRQDLAALDGQRAQNSENLSTAKEYRSGLISRQQILGDLENKLEGIDQGVQQILKARRENRESFFYIKGMVAELISADVSYASIVDSALANHAQFLVANSTTAALADSDTLSELRGRVQMICLDAIDKPSGVEYIFSGHPEVKGMLVDYVTYDDEFELLARHLLGKTVLVENIAAAVKLKKIAPADYRFVTLSGETVECDGTMHIGPQTSQLSLVSRKSEIRQIEDNLVEVETRIEDLTNSSAQMAGQADHLDNSLQALRTSIYENNTEEVQAKSRLEQVEETLQRLQQEQPLVASEIAEYTEQIEEAFRQQTESQSGLGDLEENQQLHQTRIESFEEMISSLEARDQLLGDQVTEIKVTVGQMVQERLALYAKIKRIETQQQQLDINVDSLGREILHYEENHKQAELNILAAESKISELYLLKEQAQKVAAEFGEQAAAAQSEKDQLTQQSQEIFEAREALQEKLHSLEMKLNEARLKRESLMQRAMEELELDLVARYDTILAAKQAALEPPVEVDASLGEGEVEVETNLEDEESESDSEEGAQEKEAEEEQHAQYDLDNLDFEAVAIEIDELKKKISRLGNVNLDAIGEQTELEQRSEYLNGQATDLQDSKDELEALIDELNDVSRAQFKESFDQIKVHFSELFRKLFGGGRAEVILEDVEDLLECDIEIVARPPGKQLQSISLLSGGEKTMTAVALLLAIFKSNPSPFCILDEADAALDEANNERYNLVIKEFLDTSQFIVITHSRRTMSVGDTLYGVTMQERGVSKKVSVRFADDDVVDELVEDDAA